MTGCFTKISHTVRMVLFWIVMIHSAVLLSLAGWLMVNEEGDKEHGKEST